MNPGDVAFVENGIRGVLSGAKARRVWENHIGAILTHKQDVTGWTKQALSHAVHDHRVLRPVAADGSTGYSVAGFDDSVPHGVTTEASRRLSGFRVSGLGALTDHRLQRTYTVVATAVCLTAATTGPDRPGLTEVLLARPTTTERVRDMRSKHGHLRLVGTAATSAAPVIDVTGDVRGITVIVWNVRPGQICEIVHREMFSLSDRVVVANEDTSAVIASFSLQHGTYEVSLRVDGALQHGTVPMTAVVGPQAAIAPASTA